MISSVETNLTIAANSMGERLSVLLPIVKEYILTRLNDTINPDNPVKDWLSAMDYGDDTLGDEGWFVDHFPVSLEHKHIVPAYIYLEKKLIDSLAHGAATDQTDSMQGDGIVEGGGIDGDGDVQMGQA